MHNKHRRILWLLNHRTLMPFEIPALINLGYEVFTPKVIPGTSFRSGAVSFEYDKSLTLPKSVLDRLNSFDFYLSHWPADIERLVNRYFAAVFIIPYGKQVSEAIDKFDGQVIFRAFGLDNKRTYRGVLKEMYGPELLWRLETIKDRFWFAQGYDNLSEVETELFKMKSVHLPLGLPEGFFKSSLSWRGGNRKILFVSPNATTDPYYSAVYSEFKRDFGDLPHVIVGHQDVAVNDPNMAGFVTDDELNALYVNCAALYYHSREPRHVHYSPIEAAICGLPVVYYKDSLFDRLCPRSLKGAVATVDEARELLMRLLSSDRGLIEELCSDQRQIADVFDTNSMVGVWRRNLQSSGLGAKLAATNTQRSFIRELKSRVPLKLKSLFEETPSFSPASSAAISKEVYGSSIYDGVVFSDSELPSFIVSITGLSVPEWFGRWSDGKKVTLRLSHMLDLSFVLELTAFAYGENQGKHVSVKIGGSAGRAKFSSSPEKALTVCMPFKLNEPTNIIEFVIPKPSSVPNDSRRLGLAFVKLRVRPCETDPIYLASFPVSSALNTRL